MKSGSSCISKITFSNQRERAKEAIVNPDDCLLRILFFANQQFMIAVSAFIERHFLVFMVQVIKHPWARDNSKTKLFREGIQETSFINVDLYY